MYGFDEYTIKYIYIYIYISQLVDKNKPIDD